MSSSKMIVRESLLFELGQICLGDMGFLGVWETAVKT